MHRNIRSATPGAHGHPGRGGRENVREIETIATSRLRVTVANATAVDENAIRSLGLRGLARPTKDRVHILIGPAANEALALLRARL